MIILELKMITRETIKPTVNVFLESFEAFKNKFLHIPKSPLIITK